MYNPISIAPLSESQILKALKGLPVRVSVGNQHDVELSAQQFKNLSKAHQKGKILTITMDPYQVQNHMHLLEAGKLKKNIRGNAGRLITSATDRSIRAMEGGNITATAKDSGKHLLVGSTDRALQGIEGSGINGRLQYFMEANREGGATEDARRYGKGIGGNITLTAKGSGKRLLVGSTDRALRGIEGSSIGGSVNRLKKGQCWEQLANATIRDGIDTAGKAARVYYDSTGPMAQMGFGLKKRGRPRKMQGSALYPAGVY